LSLAIDIEYYFKTTLDSENLELFSRYFSKNNFKNLYTASSFFKNLKAEDVAWISNKTLASKILTNAKTVGDKLETQFPKILDIYKEDILPRVKIETLLYDLEPKIGHSNTILKCPCCDKKEAFIGNKGKGSTIVCNRQNKCGETTTILSHIMDREGLSFYKAVEFISDNAGINLQALISSKEVQKNKDNSVNYIKKRVEVSRVPNVREYIPEDIKFKTLDSSKKYQTIQSSNYIHQFKEMNNTQKYQLVLGYIRDFAMANKDEKKIYDFFCGRGLTLQHFSKDVGYISKDKVPVLVKNLKDIFNENELVKLEILSEKGYWKHGAVNKDTNKFSYCDALLFSMHNPYSNIPTNLEFRFIGDGAKNIKNKTSAIENSNLSTPNYYGDSYTIDSLNSKGTWWFCEGAIDAKTISAMGYNAVSLIGVHKHFAENLGYFKGKTAIIAFDQDHAGIKNVQKFAEKLYLAGAKQIVVASWDMDIAKDCNDLLKEGKLEEIKFSLLKRNIVEVDGYKQPVFQYSTNTTDINRESLIKRLGLIEELEKKEIKNFEKNKEPKATSDKISIDENNSSSLGLEQFLMK